MLALWSEVWNTTVPVNLQPFPPAPSPTCPADSPLE